MASAETLALRARSVATNSGINPGAVALALAVPFLFLHIKYQPGVRVPLGSTHLGLELSDVAIVVVALVALREGLKMGFAPLRPALPLWIASAALLLWIFIRSGSLEHFVTATKFSEYALLAFSAPLILRRRTDWELVAAAVVAWSVVATCFALLQFLGVDMADAWAAGRRQPSFLGHSDFAALSALALGIGFAAVLLARKRIGWAAIATGGDRSDPVRRDRGADRDRRGNGGIPVRRLASAQLAARDVAVSGIVVGVVAIGVLVLRAGDFENFLRFVHLKGKRGADHRHPDVLAPHAARLHRLPHLARPSRRRRGLAGVHRSRGGRSRSCRPRGRSSPTSRRWPFRPASTSGAFRTRISRQPPTSA